MHIPPILASLIAFAAGVFLLEMTRKKRSSSGILNFIVVAIALILSVFLAAETSQSPQASGSHMFYLWVAYAVFSMFVRKKLSAKSAAGEEAGDDPAA
jgi:ABC-type transport system involved in cytochrome c biogenesis permease subunit